MIRKHVLAGLVGMTTVIGANAALGAPLPNPSDSLATLLADQGDSYFAEADGLAALHYPRSLADWEVVARAEQDAALLGTRLVKTLAMGRIAIVEGTPSSIRARVQELEGRLPVEEVTASYRLAGRREMQSLMAFNGRLTLRFAPDASESSKVAFLASRNLKKLHETADGTLLVDTAGANDRSILALTRDVLANAAVEAAWPGIVVTGELTSSNSAGVADPFFAQQWALRSDGMTWGLFPEFFDQDLDSPRSWQINIERGVEEPYGSSSIVVGIMDSGTELAHPDLAAVLDPRFGIDYIDSGTPNPTFSAFGAHGTMMAGVVAGAMNDIGGVGVAPGVRLMTYRIFGADSSVETNSIIQALRASITQEVDINLHPYVLPFGIDETGAILLEPNYRASFESGRLGTGTPNIAAAGNFFSQVEYPASSVYTISVGAHTINGVREPFSNWGGEGTDLIAPSIGSYPFIVPDLTGSAGHAGGDFVAAGIFSISDPPASITSFPDVVDGTSFSAAAVAGVAAMVMSDERYTNDPPNLARSRSFDNPLDGEVRVPSPQLNPTVLGHLTHFADRRFNPGKFPEIGFQFIDAYNEFLGGGRPNAARLVGEERDAALDGFYRRQLNPGFVLNSQFGTAAPAGSEFDEEQVMMLGDGWKAGDAQTGGGVIMADLGTGEEGEEIVISPFLEGVSALYFEDGTELTAPVNSQFYVWTDSYSTGTEELLMAGDMDVVNLRYNPQGRYHSNFPVTLTSKDIPNPVSLVATDNFDQGYVLELNIAHELGVESASTGEIGEAAEVKTELDRIVVSMYESSNERETVIAEITGDSNPGRKERLVPGQIIDIAEGEAEDPRAVWNDFFYAPFVPDEKMLIRRYRFYVPSMPAKFGMEATSRLLLKISLQPGASYLPTYDPTSEDPETLTNVFRDQKGFILHSAQMRSLRASTLNYYNQNRGTKTLGDGVFPVFAPSGNEILAVQNDESGPGSRLVAFNAERDYLTDPTDVQPLVPADYGVSIGARRARPFLSTGERVTGFAASHVAEAYAMTTAGTAEEPDGLWLVLADGTLIERVLDPSLTVGAREVSWSPRGNQLVFAGDDYIRTVSFTEDGGVLVDTPVTSERNMMTEFHSPVLSFDAGHIVFAARRIDESGMTIGSHRMFAALRTGRIVSPLGVNETLVGGWDGVDLYDFSINREGDRLLFTANADTAPGLGTVAPLNERHIFVIDNLDRILRDGHAPAYQVPELGFVVGGADGDPVGGSRRRESRWPRISSDGTKLVWVGYNNNPEPGDYSPSRVETTAMAAQIFDATPPTPTPTPATPTPDPTPTPPPTDDANVIQTGDLGFNQTAQGWVFGSAFPTYDAPAGSFTPGTLELRSVNSNSTFGFYDSPATALSAQPNSLYLYRATIAAEAGSNAAVPTVRQRVNSRTFESAFLSVTNSLGDLSLSPVNGAGRTFDLLFKPPTRLFELPSSDWTYQLSFDLLNFLEDDPNGALILDRVQLFRMDDDPASTETTVVKEVTTLLEHDLNSAGQRDLWTTGSPAEFTTPVFQQTLRGLGFRVSDGAGTFGFYTLEAGNLTLPALPAEGPVVLRIRARILSDFETDATRNPDFRIRLSTPDFQRTAEQVVTATASSTVTPSPGRALDIDTYMVLERIPDATSLLAAFDVLSFKERAVSEELYELDSVTIELVSIPRYPAIIE